MSAQLSRYGLHVIVSSYELMTAPRCCLNDSEISEFMPPGSNSGSISLLLFPKCRICICTDQHGALLPRGAMSQVRMQQLPAQAAPARPPHWYSIIFHLPAPRNDTCLLFPKCRICICTDQHGALLPRGAMSQVRMQQLPAQAAPARPLTGIPPFSSCSCAPKRHMSCYFLSVGYVSVPISTVHCCPEEL